MVHYSRKEDEPTLLREIYKGLKDGKLAQLYFVVSTTRRLLLIAVLILLQTMHFYAKMCMLMIIQISYLIYLLAVRPFESIRDNLIEILNELIILFISLILTIYSSESAWTGSIDSIVINTSLFNNIMILVIIVLALTYN